MNILVDAELVVSVFCILFRKEPERLQDGTTPSSLLSVCCFGGNIGALKKKKANKYKIIREYKIYKNYS